MDAIGRLSNVILPVDDVGEAVRFYTEVVGLPLKFRDGDRYAAFDAGGITLAVAGPQEHPPGRSTAVSFKVDDVGAAVTHLREGGASVVRAPEDGPHEVRAAVHDPGGNVLFVYAPR